MSSRNQRNINETRLSANPHRKGEEPTVTSSPVVTIPGQRPIKIRSIHDIGRVAKALTRKPRNKK